tara:strand:- start:22 stop:291 length:270 start_codon:yes stop_codon:yes gene_type:complete
MNDVEVGDLDFKMVSDLVDGLPKEASPEQICNLLMNIVLMYGINDPQEMFETFLVTQNMAMAALGLINSEEFRERTSALLNSKDGGTIH